VASQDRSEERKRTADHASPRTPATTGGATGGRSSTHTHGLPQDVHRARFGVSSPDTDNDKSSTQPAPGWNATGALRDSDWGGIRPTRSCSLVAQEPTNRPLVGSSGERRSVRDQMRTDVRSKAERVEPCPSRRCLQMPKVCRLTSRLAGDDSLTMEMQLPPRGQPARGVPEPPSGAPLRTQASLARCRPKRSRYAGHQLDGRG
jgi:hypothetical protein